MTIRRYKLTSPGRAFMSVPSFDKISKDGPEKGLTVRGSAMNPVDHPQGGGEGTSKGGRHPVTPWGVPTLGKRTRRQHKESDRLSIRQRPRGQEKRWAGRPQQGRTPTTPP